MEAASLYHPHQACNLCAGARLLAGVGLSLRQARPLPWLAVTAYQSFAARERCCSSVEGKAAVRRDSASNDTC